VSSIELTLLRQRGEEEFPKLAAKLGPDEFQELLDLIERILIASETDLVAQVERQARRG
jgi:hypothetical protein